MKNTIYASFRDTKLAHRAASALLDRGLKAEDLSIISGQDGGAIDGLSFEVAAADVFGGGPLAKYLTASSSLDSSNMIGFLKDQGIESEVVAIYESTVTHGGAILGATLPSGLLDEGQAWGILAKYAGMHVTSYINRPYVS